MTLVTPSRRTALILIIAWLLTGVYMVRVDEEAVVRRFGGVVADRVPPGLHLGFPWGIDRVDRLKVREQKRLSIGFELPDQVLGRPVNPASREFLTGDQNLVNIELLVQYTIRDPRAYLFATSDVTAAMRQAAEAAIAVTVAERPVDTLLTSGKLKAQEDLRRQTQESVDTYGLGVAVTAVNLQSISPPVKVADAFRQVASAREDRDRIISEAESYANAALPAAQAEASKMAEEAAAYRDQKTLDAEGDASRFIQAYEAYRLSPDVTSTRLYLEAVEQILPHLKIISVDQNGSHSPVDLNLLSRSAPPAAASPGIGNDSNAPTSPTVNP